VNIHSIKNFTYISFYNKGKKVIFLLVFFSLIYFSSFSQNKNSNNKRQISTPEKCWAIKHPFIAKKAFHLTIIAINTTKETKQQNVLDQEENGGKLDAFRHAYWMALLAQKIGPKKAKQLGIAHEKGDKIKFKKKHFEEGTVPDSISCEMDLYNNQAGIDIGISNKKATENELKQFIISAINNGELKIIAKNEKGDLLDCSGNIIPKEALINKWNNAKCLVNSNYKYNK